MVINSNKLKLKIPKDIIRQQMWWAIRLHRIQMSKIFQSSTQSKMGSVKFSQCMKLKLNSTNKLSEARFTERKFSAQKLLKNRSSHIFIWEEEACQIVRSFRPQVYLGVLLTFSSLRLISQSEAYRMQLTKRALLLAYKFMECRR